MNAYEGMFVIDLQEVRKGTDDAEEKVRGLIQKSGGETAIMTRWDERKLAYEIKGRDGGLYLLTYFTGGPDVVRTLTRECRLTSFVLRTLILRVAGIPDPETLSNRARREKAIEEHEDGGPRRRPFGGGRGARSEGEEEEQRGREAGGPDMGAPETGGEEESGAESKAEEHERPAAE